MTPERLLVHARAILTDRFGNEPSAAFEKHVAFFSCVGISLGAGDPPPSVRHSIWQRILAPAWSNLNLAVARSNAGRTKDDLWWATMWQPLWFVHVDDLGHLNIVVCTEPDPAKQIEALTKAEAEAA